VNIPPSDKPLSVLRVCHSCFLLRTASGSLLLVDPYFGGPFRWKGREERHLGPPPAATPDDIEGLAGIIITHEHPDHCQGDALYRLMSRNSCELWGPAGIYRRAVEVGIDNHRVNKIEAFQRFQVGEFEVLGLPNRGSEDAKPCMRMSYVFAAGGTGVFHGGDSHGPSPSWAGHVEGVPLALLWPNHIERTVAFLRPHSVALMHCDRFEPGNFLCGYDEDQLREKLRRRARGTRVLAPATGEWFWPEQLSAEELQRLNERPAGRRRPRDRGQPREAESTPGPGAAGPSPSVPATEGVTPPPPPPGAASERPVAPAAPAAEGPGGAPEAPPSAPTGPQAEAEAEAEAEAAS
jgi:L-ascorbate metabolism protein UlaG (beta-lactamase superfamily)